MKKCKYIFVCMGKDCKKAGSSRLKKTIKGCAMEMQEIEKLKIIKTECMDQCKHGPNVIFNEKIFQSVKDENIVCNILRETEQSPS